MNFDIYNTFYGNRHISVTSTAGDPANGIIEHHSEMSFNSEVSHIYKILNSLPDNAVIMDGGANLGYITVPMALKLKNTNAKIISIEAQRRMFYALAGTIALNDLYNVHAYNLALGEERGFVDMPDTDYGANTDFGSISVSGKANEMSYLNNTTTLMVTIDSLKLPRLDFLKLDVEGYEPAALRGGLETIRANRPWMWIEYYDCVSTYNQDKIKAILEPLGNYSFHYLKVDRQNMLCIPNEKREGVNLDFIAEPV